MKNNKETYIYLYINAFYFLLLNLINLNSSFLISGYNEAGGFVSSGVGFGEATGGTLLFLSLSRKDKTIDLSILACSAPLVAPALLSLAASVF